MHPGQCAAKIQKDGCLNPESERILQASIKKVTEDYEAAELQHRDFPTDDLPQ